MLTSYLRDQGERGTALMSERWPALQHGSLSPTTIGNLGKSALVLTRFEHKCHCSLHPIPTAYIEQEQRKAGGPPPPIPQRSPVRGYLDRGPLKPA